MFISKRRHLDEIDALRTELRDKSAQIVELQQKVNAVERSRHEIVEDVRYVLQAGGGLVGKADPLRGDELKAIGHYLPYLLSSRRHWDYESGFDQASAEEARRQGVEYGLNLPEDPAQAVRAFLDYAHEILLQFG